MILIHITTNLSFSPYHDQFLRQTRSYFKEKIEIVL